MIEHARFAHNEVVASIYRRDQPERADKGGSSVTWIWDEEKETIKLSEENSR